MVSPGTPSSLPASADVQGSPCDHRAPGHTESPLPSRPSACAAAAESGRLGGGPLPGGLHSRPHSALGQEPLRKPGSILNFLKHECWPSCPSWPGESGDLMKNAVLCFSLPSSVTFMKSSLFLPLIRDRTRTTDLLA